MVMPSAQRCSRCGQAYMSGDCIQWPPTCTNCDKSDDERTLDLLLKVGPDLAALARRVLALETDIRAGLKIAHELTPETQTVEEACAELVRLVRKAREERDVAQQHLNAAPSPSLQEEIWALQEHVTLVESERNEATCGLTALRDTLPRCSWSGCNRIGTKWIARHVANCDDHGAEYLQDTPWAEYVRKEAT